MLIALCLALYLPGINWGLPAVVSWSQDTIAGVRTLGAVESWATQWTGRYPPLHYLLLRAAYEPVLRHWQVTGQMTNDSGVGRASLTPPHAPKVGLLILIARVVATVMAAGAVMALWLAARRFTGDDLAAGTAAISFALGAGFTYFAHLGNVDVPSICWLTISLVFYARCLQGSNWRDAALLGLFGSACISTKDNWAGLYAGMALVLLVNEWDRLRRGKSSLVHAVGRAAFQARWAVGAAAFVVPYALLNGVFTDPKAWLDRIKALADALGGSEYRQPTQASLAIATARQAASAVGWPMLAAMLAGCAYTLRRRPRLALAMLLPCISYYLIVVVQIGFVYERFLFGPLALLSILVGWSFADWARCDRVAAKSRADQPEYTQRVAPWAAAAFVLLPTLGYSVAVDLEMLGDSRYAAERWFEENVPKDASVGALAGELRHFSPQYLPRLHEMGYATYPVHAVRESFDSPQPDVLILSGYDQQDFDDAGRRCLADLLAGRLGYEPFGEFRGRYLGTGSSWLSLAGWYAPVPGKISPTLTILRVQPHQD